MPLGINDIKTVIRIPTNWDLAYMRQWQTADGVSWDQVITRVGAALTLFNQSLTTGVWAPYIRTTTELEVEYPTGGDATELPPMPEHGRPDLLAGETTGHMIPMKDYGGSLGWTSLALRRASAQKIDDSVRTLLDRSRNTWQKRILERLFKSVADTVGSTGKSAPFADGGTADADYAPRPWDGNTFDATHNHFLRYTDDAAGRTAALAAMVNTLREHGHVGPYILTIPEVDTALWTAQAEFVKPDRAAVLTAGVEKRAIVPNPDVMVGLFETDRGWGYVMPSARVPANYVGLERPYGYNNPNNPLAVRFERGYPLGISIEGQVIQFPLQEAAAMFTFGVSVNDRTNGAASYFAAAGAYVDPVIS